jgi:putative hemolysin
MTGLPIVEVIIILVLIVANGFFAASEIAVVSARHSRLQQQADAGKKSARQALELTNNSDRFLATAQIGITLIGTLASAFGGASISAVLAKWLVTFPLLKPYADTLALAIVVLIITYFTLVIGELAPKRMALRSPEGIATLAAPFMTAMSKFAGPVVAFLTFSTNVILRLLGQHETLKQEVTEEDIVYLTHEGMTSGTVEEEEEAFITRIFRFSDRTVSSVMMPRTEIVAVEVGTALEQVIDTFLSSGYTRIPLYEGSMDNIIGILYSKDLLRARSRNEEINLIKLARQPFFISEYQHVNDLLNTFRRLRNHMAIVIDEYSQVVGLVTLEDLLEELVGEIQDEYDEPENNTFVQRADGSWLVDAMISQEIVREKLGMTPQSENGRGGYHTLAGMLLVYMGRIPAVGDKVTIDNFVFEIVDMDGRRIDKVLIQPVEQSSKQSSEQQSQFTENKN